MDMILPSRGRNNDNNVAVLEKAFGRKNISRKEGPEKIGTHAGKRHEPRQGSEIPRFAPCLPFWEQTDSKAQKKFRFPSVYGFHGRRRVDGGRFSKDRESLSGAVLPERGEFCRISG